MIKGHELRKWRHCQKEGKWTLIENGSENEKQVWMGMNNLKLISIPEQRYRAMWKKKMFRVIRTLTINEFWRVFSKFLATRDNIRIISVLHHVENFIGTANCWNTILLNQFYWDLTRLFFVSNIETYTYIVRNCTVPLLQSYMRVH